MHRDPSDPIRLIESDVDPLLRDAVNAGLKDVPNAAQMAELSTKLGLIVGTGIAAGATVSKGSALAAAAKMKLVASLLTIGAGVAAVGVYWKIASHEPPPTAEAVSPATPARRTPAAPPALSPSVEAPTVSVAIPEAPAPIPRQKPPASNPEAEAAILRDAQDALRSDPGHALDLCKDHERRFAGGMLAQEREVIAIHALVRLGEMQKANARAQKFASTYPHSSHLQRIRALLGDGSPSP
jgi:hypothetical protein